MLHCIFALYHDRNTVDWTRWRHKINAQRGPASARAGPKEAISHLCRNELKRPTPVQRRLSRTQALLGRVAPGSGCRCRGWKCGVLWGCPPTPHSIGDPPSAPHVCCYCQNWWVVVRRVQMGVSIWGAVHCTRWTGEHWVEQVSRVHGTAY